MTLLRPELPPIPEYMKHLPVFRGYPTPWFVHMLENGEPEFRIVNPRKMVQAVRQSLCWVCGLPFTNRRKAFVIGPMCSVNRISAEPPCHIECARFSALACPFLTRPQMVRRDMESVGELEKIHMNPAMNPRNPGATAVWHTRSYDVDQNKTGVFFRMGDPTDCEWYKEGRPATRAEAMEALEAGEVLLLEEARKHGEEDLILEDIKWVKENLMPRTAVTA